MNPRRRRATTRPETPATGLVVPEQATRPDAFLSDALPRFLSLLQLTQRSVSTLAPGVSLPEDAVRAVAQACDAVIAEGGRALRRAPNCHSRRALQGNFRESLRPLAEGNPLLERSLQEESAGTLPGLLDEVYAPEPVFAGGLGGLIDRYLREACRFVIDRKDYLSEHLAHVVREAVGRDARPTVLALGAASCREWVELDWDLGRPAERWARIDLVAIDRDEAALQRAAARLERNRLLRRARFVVADLPQLEPTLDAMGPLSLDVAYAVGVADLLRDRLLTELLRIVCPRVAPGGHLVLTHTDPQRARLEVGEWFLGLRFIPRSPSEFATSVRRGLRHLSCEMRLRLRRDPAGTTVFAFIDRGTRPGG